MRNSLNSSVKLQITGLTSLLVLTIISVTGCHTETPIAATTVDPGDEKIAAAQIKEGDRLYEAREDMAKARVAVATLRQAVVADYGSFEAAWKLARASYFVGDHTQDSDEAEKMFRTGIEASKSAIKLQPQKPEGHFWLGANFGGEAKLSTLSSLSTVTDIRTEMETVIRLDEKFQSGSAYLALGRLYLQAPKVLGGDTSKAIDYLKKGLTLAPNNSLMKYYLAEAYQSENRDAEAKKLIEEIIATTPDPQYVAEHKDAIAKANKLKEKMG